MAPSDMDASGASRSEIRSTMLRVLRERGPDKTACPSAVAREIREDGWRELLPLVRDVARELVAEDRVNVTQGGRPVSPTDASGPIRIGICPEPESEDS